MRAEVAQPLDWWREGRLMKLVGKKAMPALASSAISAVSYNATARLLFITFHSGGPYTFYRVPPEIYYGLITAASAGRYYHDYIRGRYGP